MKVYFIHIVEKCKAFLSKLKLMPLPSTEFKTNLNFQTQKTNFPLLINLSPNYHL